MENIDFDALTAEVAGLIDRRGVLVLATCADNRVTARPVSVVRDGLIVYFQTDRESLKFTQLSANPRVALCIDNLQIEGVAEVLGHPLSPACTFFAERYKTVHRGSFEAYSALPGNVVIAVKIGRAGFWKYDERHKPFRDDLDVAKATAQRRPQPTTSKEDRPSATRRAP